MRTDRAAMVAFLALAAPASAADPKVPGRRAPAELQAAFRSAYHEVRSCVYHANLLLASSQAALKRLQFSANQLSLPAAKATARAAFEEHTAALERFRYSAESADAGGPRAEARTRVEAKQPDLAEGSTVSEGPTGDLIDQILQMRGDYKPEESRKAVPAAAGGLKTLDADLGPSRMTAAEARIVQDARTAARRLATAAERLRRQTPKTLPASDNAGRRKAHGLALRDIEQLSADSLALSDELALLETRYRLNAHYRGHPEWKEAP